MSTQRPTNHEAATEQSAQQGMQQAAVEEAGGGQLTLQDLRDDPDLIGELFDPHINPDPEQLPEDLDVADLEAFLNAEFGRHVGLGNISREEWAVERDMDRAKSLLTLQEFRRPGGMGRGCTGAVRRIMTGQETDPEPLTPYVQRTIRRAHEERSMLRSLSINGRGWRGLTEFLAVTMSQGFGDGDGDDEDGGMLSSALNKLP